jgi:glycosyltransferase involved in cell wall biosynthesis
MTTMPQSPTIRLVTSIIIAAYNEAAVIGRCLDALAAGARPGEFDVTVVANGCTDTTVKVAGERAGVRVLDLPEPGKVAALNAGDAAALSFPRVYLDADIVMGAEGIRELIKALDPVRTDGTARVLAAAPRREFDCTGSPLLVRAYFAIHSRLPAFEGALFGRGAIAISAEGRTRFDNFPDVIADDLFLDALFTAAEKRQVDAVASRVTAPRRLSDLMRRLVRVRRGNAGLRRQEVGPGQLAVRPASRLSWLRDVALRQPILIPASICYAGITVVAAVLSRLPARPGTGWGRDNSTR